MFWLGINSSLVLNRNVLELLQDKLILFQSLREIRCIRERKGTCAITIVSPFTLDGEDISKNKSVEYGDLNTTETHNVTFIPALNVNKVKLPLNSGELAC